MIFVCLALLAAALVLVLVGIISSSVGAAVAALVCAVAGTGLLLAVYAAYRQRMLAEGTATDVEPVRAPSPAVVAAGGLDGAAPAYAAAPVRSVGGPPVPHYADLTAQKAAALVATLNLDELHDMRRYEVEHAGRRAVLTAVDRRIEEIVALRKQLA